MLAITGFLVVFGSIGVPAHVEAAIEQNVQVVQVIPAILDGENAYPSRFASSPVSAWNVSRWQSVTFPESWVNKGFYVELWDGGNRPIPGFAARKLTHITLSLTAVDATLYPDVRAVLFQPASLPKPETVGQVTFSFTT